MKYLKLFENHAGYEAYINGGGVVLPNVSYCISENEVHYKKKPNDFSKDYLTFEAVEDTTFTFSNSGLSYSTDDGNTWTALAANTATPKVSAGNKILFKGEMTPGSVTKRGIGTFSNTGKFNASGNIMSLLYGDNFIGQTDLTGKNWAFYQLFYNDVYLVGAADLILPATTLATGCYNGMFKGCTSLTTAPELPAKTLANNCYASMFASCTSLATAPELPATTLGQSCYNNMFSDCKSLSTAPELLPATTLAFNCYSGMFSDCKSLVTAPELPATTLAGSCYSGMFFSCSNLNYIKAMFTTTPTNADTGMWVSAVADTGTFVKNSAATWNVTGPNGIPNGWTIETASA